MSDELFVRCLDLAAGLVLVCAFVAVWRRGLVAVVRAIAVQGIALAAVAALLGVHEGHVEPIVVALLVVALKGVVLPGVLGRIMRGSDDARDAIPLVNIPASLLAAAALTLLAYASTRAVVSLDPSPEAKAIPIGFAVVLIGLFVLVTRRKAVSQIAGFVLVDNGIALVAFLATSGVPLIVELGVAFDVLLAVLVLQVLDTRMRVTLGAVDLDQMRELHD